MTLISKKVELRIELVQQLQKSKYVIVKYVNGYRITTSCGTFDNIHDARKAKREYLEQITSTK